MDSIWQLLYKFGLPSYFTQVSAPVPTAAQLEIQIAKKLPVQIGRVFGLSTYCDTVAPDNSPLITTTDATNIYLNIIDGATKFFSPIRLSELNFEFAGVPTPGQSPRYMPCNLPRFDLSTSNYINPTGIVSAASPAKPSVIMLNMWYISFDTYNYLLEKQVVFDGGMPREKPIVQNG